MKIKIRDAIKQKAVNLMIRLETPVKRLLN